MAASSSARRQPGGSASRPRRTGGRPRRRLRGRVGPRIAVTALLSGALVGTVVALWAVHEIRSRSGGFEEWVGDSVSELRLAHPGLVEPLARIEDRTLELLYRAKVRWHGQKHDGTAAEADDGNPDPATVASAPQEQPESPTAVEVNRPGNSPNHQAASTTGRAASSADEPTTGSSANPADSQPAPDQDAATAAPRSEEAAARARATTAKPGDAETAKPEETATAKPDEAATADASAPGAQVAPQPSTIRGPLDWKPLHGAPSWAQQAWLVSNPAFPHDPSMLLQFDTRRATVHWQPGKRSPWNMTPTHQTLADANPKPDRSGKIPAAALRDTIVAFGGGFESIHFYNYGGIHRGETVVPLTAGIQTWASYRDGSMRIAPWGSAELPKEGIVEARQNLPPLIHHGRIPANIVSLNNGTLTATYTLDSEGHRIYTDVHTWRSGLGLTPDAQVVYAFGPFLNPKLLAETLLKAGVVEAMMLDINAAYHCTPTLVVPDPHGKPQVLGIFPKVNCGDRFVKGGPKDFFWIATRGSEGAPA